MLPDFWVATDDSDSGDGQLAAKEGFHIIRLDISLATITPCWGSSNGSDLWVGVHFEFPIDKFPGAKDISSALSSVIRSNTTKMKQGSTTTVNSGKPWPRGEEVP